MTTQTNTYGVYDMDSFIAKLKAKAIVESAVFFYEEGRVFSYRVSVNDEEKKTPMEIFHESVSRFDRGKENITMVGVVCNDVSFDPESTSFNKELKLIATDFTRTYVWSMSKEGTRSKWIYEPFITREDFIQ